MPQQRFFIGPPQSGLENNYKDWIIPDDAYSKLENAYVWRGSLRKRFGSEWMGQSGSGGKNQTLSRLRIALTPAGLVVTTIANVAIGQMFSIDSDIFTVESIGINDFLLTTSAVTAQLTAANQVTFSAIAGTVYWYPSLPVMGIETFDTDSINDEFPIAWDTTYSYKYDNGWERLALGTATWTGDNADFFWATNYRAYTADENVLFATNFVAADGIRYYNDEAINGGAIAAGTWTKAAFKYSSTATDDDIVTARIIIYFKDRLVLLNTIEEVGSADKEFPNRCRFSQNGSPFEANAWYQAPEAYGKGGYIDAPTTEAIVTAQFLKDRLIVFFERSTYELVYTGNRIQPFIWQKINTELGAESTFSQVPFDNAVLGVGNVGIHSCDGASVQRIDEKIPQEVFKIHNDNDGPVRVAGIRDYRSEMVYWAFPDFNNTNDSVFPNRVLVYNYSTGTWSFNDDSITVFNYWQRDEDLRWNDMDFLTWQEWDSIWSSGSSQSKERFVIAGNQQGYTFYLDRDITYNVRALQVTGLNSSTFVVDCINHNLTDNDYIYIDGANGIAGINGEIFKIVTTSSDLDSFTLLPTDTQAAAISGTYTGGGTLARVSNIEVETKDFSFFIKDGQNLAIDRVEFYVDTTEAGEITVDCLPSSSNLELVPLADGSVNAPILGESILETSTSSELPFPGIGQKRVWSTVYFSAVGESLKLSFYFTPNQLRDPNSSRVDFQINSMIIYATPAADR